MKTADLLKSYHSTHQIDAIGTLVSVAQLTLLGEISLYQHFDETDCETELISGTEINRQIELFKMNGINRICLHYGYFFNADYQSILAYTEYILKHFNGEIFCYSPEELVYLSIIAHKEIDEIVADLKRIGVSQILGYLPKSIIESTFYAEDDELFIDDRHTFLAKLISVGIKFQYPVNLSQVETTDELNQIIEFIKENELTDIIIQPNRPIESDSIFDYKKAQAFATHLFDKFSIPLIEVKQNNFELLTEFGGFQFYRIAKEDLIAYDYSLSGDSRIKIK